MARKPTRKRKKEKTFRYFDYTLLFIIIFLVGFGLVMLYSTSSYNAQVRFGDSAYYLRRQVYSTILGFCGMILVSNIDYHFWFKLSGLVYLVSFGLCVAVLFVGANYNGSTRWLSIGPLSFQPSETAKIAVILLYATVLTKTANQLVTFKNIFKIVLLAMPIAGIVALNNLSTAIIIIGIAICMIFVASKKYWQLLVMGVIVAAGGAAFIFMEDYRRVRIDIWFHPENYDKGYQTLQGLYAIGSGGLFGKGLGESMQKLGFLPEAQNDMIFSIICEELGLFGAICVIMLFLLLIWRFMVIANNAADMIGALIVVGIMSHIALQVILNIGVVTNTFPNTGVTLPFISYGGTSVIILLAEMGLALNVSKGIKFDPV